MLHDHPMSQLFSIKIADIGQTVPSMGGVPASPSHLPVWMESLPGMEVDVAGHSIPVKESV